MMRRIIIPFILVLFLSFSCLKVHATCVNYSGGSGCDVDAGGGYIPEASGPVAVDTSSSTSSTTKSVHKASTVSVPVVPSTSDMVKSAVVTDVVGGLLASAFSSPSPPPGPTPEEIAAQKLAEEKKKQAFLKAKADLNAHLKQATGYVKDDNVVETNGVMLKSLSGTPEIPAVASAVTASNGNVHQDFFGQTGAVNPKVALLQDANAPNLTEEDKIRIAFEKRTGGPRVLEDYPAHDRYAFVQKEQWSDPWKNVAVAMGTASGKIALDLIVKEKVLKEDKIGGLFVDANTTYGEKLIEPAGSSTAEQVLDMSDYGVLLIPEEYEAGALVELVKVIGAGVREKIVQDWAQENREGSTYTPHPLEDARDRWNSFYIDRGEWTKAALDKVGAGAYKDEE
jgi:hypothetical protein